MPADLKVKTPLQNSHTQRFHRLGTRAFELKWAHWSLKQVLKGRTILYDAVWTKTVKSTEIVSPTFWNEIDLDSQNKISMYVPDCV